MVSTVARVKAVSWACGWSAAPVVSDGLALLAGGTRWADGTGDEVPVLQAVDEEGERFRLTWPDSGRDIEPGAVTVAPGGDLVFPVYEHDTSLQVLRVSRDGAVVARDELPDDPYDVVAFDVASKLRVAVTPVNGQDYLCSWLYRQGRTQGTTYRSWGEPDYRWYGEEWPLSVGDDQVVGTNGGRWVSRDLATGAVRWFADMAGYRPAGSGPGSLYAVRAGPDADPKPGEWSTVLALDPRIGRPRWETQVDGTVRSATSGPGTVCVAAELPDGTRRLTALGADGEVTSTRALTDGTVIAVAQDLIIALTRDNQLEAFDQSLAPRWSLAVDPPAVGYAARIADGLTVVAATTEGRRAYLRGEAGLQIVEW